MSVSRHMSGPFAPLVVPRLEASPNLGDVCDLCTLGILDHGGLQLAANAREGRGR